MNSQTPGDGNEKSDSSLKVDRKWTVMVFMGVETESGNAPLIEAAQADINEMAAVGSGGTLNILVQKHGKGVPRRYHIGKHEEDVPPDKQEVKGGRALANFIEWSLTKPDVNHQPHDHSMLVLWGHAYDFAIGHAPTRNGTIDALDFIELGEVLQRLQDDLAKHYRTKQRSKMDIVAFDACDVATVEMALQLFPFAKYLLGSEMGVPIPGWPYDRILGRLRYPKGRLMGTAEFGSYAVRRYCESYAALQRAVSLTLLDLQQAPDLFARTEVLATVLDVAITERPAMRELVAQLFSRAQTADYKPYVDVADLCLNLMRESGDPLVIEAARALGDFLLTPSPEVVVGKSVDGTGRPFVVEHGRNAAATAKLNGVSIYAPHVAPANDSASLRRLYGDFEFARQTRWSRLVHGLAGLRLGS